MRQLRESDFHNGPLKIVKLPTATPLYLSCATTPPTLKECNFYNSQTSLNRSAKNKKTSTRFRGNITPKRVDQNDDTKIEERKLNKDLEGLGRKDYQVLLKSDPKKEESKDLEFFDVNSEYEN